MNKQSQQKIIFLIASIAIFVESLLFPFYPQFFQKVFGIESNQTIGLYVSTCRLVMMFSFPLWAILSKKIASLKLLMITQFLAGSFSLLCYWNEDFSFFWFFSLVMVFFKSSYLLLYPYLVTKNEEHQLHTISTLSVIVQFSLLAAALVGGFVLEYFNPLLVFLLMGIADFVQMALCFVLFKNTKEEIVEVKKVIENTHENKQSWVLFSLITFLFYFSTAVIRPFFTNYWKENIGETSIVWIGIVFVIPSIMALILLPIIKKILVENQLYARILIAFIIAMIGLFVQLIPFQFSIILGRIIYGMALFVGQVGLDLWLFSKSEKSAYAINYSKIHIFQSLGMLLAPVSAGVLIDEFGIRIPFYIAIFGLGLSLIVGIIYRKKSDFVVRPIRF